MTDHPISIAGIFIPTSEPTFLVVLSVHVVAGLCCVIAGAVAMLSRKGRGNHTRAGLLYYGSLMVVFATMSALAAMRWAHDYYLFLLGLLSFSAAAAGRRFVNHPGPWRVRAHIVGMGASYVLLLIAFYVDNGPNLPLWRRLPHIAYWGLPLLVGGPLIARAVVSHPIARAERRRRS